MGSLRGGCKRRIHFNSEAASGLHTPLSKNYQQLHLIKWKSLVTRNHVSRGWKLDEVDGSDRTLLRSGRGPLRARRARRQSRRRGLLSILLRIILLPSVLGRRAGRRARGVLPSSQRLRDAATWAASHHLTQKRLQCLHATESSACPT